MGLFNALEVAGTGMSAQTVRLNTTASNIANAETVSSNTNETYRAKHPLFSTLIDEQMNEAVQGVRVSGIVESNAPLRQEYNPGHPMADENGNIFLPNVNVVEEMANMLSAARSYEANVEVVNTSKQLILRTLSLGQ